VSITDNGPTGSLDVTRDIARCDILQYYTEHQQKQRQYVLIVCLTT